MKIAMFFVAIGFGTLLTLGCSRTQDTTFVPRNVKVVTPESAGGITTHAFNGVLEEARKVDLAFRVGGPVIGVFAEEGDFVRQGTLLAAIDPRDYQVQLRSAEVQFKQAKGEYDRFKELYEQGKLPSNTIEKLEAAFLAAESNLDRARHALEDTRLLAPFSGTVFQKNINKHETTAAGMVVFTIIDMSELEVVFGVPESLVVQMTTPAAAKVQVGRLSLPATIKSVAGKSGEDNLFEVRLAINNPDAEAIRPGMNARIELELEKGKQAGATVPVEAVFYLNGAPFVWIYDELSSTIASRAIQSGQLLTGGRMEIISGIDMDDKIVSAGVHSLFEDQKVRAMN